MPANVPAIHCPECGTRLEPIENLLKDVVKLLAQSVEVQQMVRDVIREAYPEGRFVASKIGEHFHRPHCKWAREISDWNFIEFDLHEDAVAAGKKPCKTCRS